MFTDGRKKGTIRFTVSPKIDVNKVKLAGDFNGCKALVMKRQKNGEFVAIIPLDAGMYEYKFLFDDQWMTDPDNETWALNPFGTVNSVAWVQ